MPKHSTTRQVEASRRAERLPGYILALANNELTYWHMLEQDVVFCQTCSQALIE
jgi:hypothetical protein